MAQHETDRLIHRLITDDRTKAEDLIRGAATCEEPLVLVVAALMHPSEVGLLTQALRMATSTRDRQVIAIAAAFLAGETDRVDALAREHLLDHPDSVLVAWIAASTRRPHTPPQSHPDHSRLEES